MFQGDGQKTHNHERGKTKTKGKAVSIGSNGKVSPCVDKPTRCNTSYEWF